MFDWLKRLFRKEEAEARFLRPGTCECDHERCCHVKGRGKCKAEYPPDKETPYWTGCTCQVYIPDSNSDGDPDPTPTPSELEELYRR